MRPRFVCLLTCLLSLTGSTFTCDADDPVPLVANAPTTEPSDGSTLHSYMVQLTEFRMKTGNVSKLNAKDLIRILEGLKEDSDVEVIQTIRLSTLTTHESMVQFGKKVRITTGAGQSNFGDLGTIVRVLAKEEKGKVLTKLSYEASRNHGDASDFSPTTTQFETTLLLKASVPTLVGSTTSDPSSCLLICITE